jgi:UDP-2-acetamido-3-amino-2,3-dideoxy-glucuronate N-acetyltransferase
MPASTAKDLTDDAAASATAGEKPAFIHPQAICEGEVGAGTRVWAFAHVLPGARIGRDCNICDGVFVEGDVVVGDAVTVKCGVQLWDGVRLENDVFVGPNATFSNDRFPRSRQPPEAFAVTTVQEGASIGANATILPGITIGRGAMVGAGAVVTADLPPRVVAVGNPARIVGYADAVKLGPEDAFPADFPARMLNFGAHVNALGRLSIAETADLPFAPQRLFMVDGVPAGQIRGAHAHRMCDQILIATSGSVTAAVDDGRNAFSVKLDRPDRALYMPAGLWGSQFAYSPGSTLLVLASAPYDKADYIFDYGDFLAFTAGR